MRVLYLLVSIWLPGASTFLYAENVFAEVDPEYYLDQFAPTEQTRASWQEAREVFLAFVATPEFIGREPSRQDRKVRQQLEDACLSNFRDCQSYLRKHRAKVLSALPDNPRYWQRFWRMLEVNPHTFLPSDASPDYQRLIPATYWWFYRDLAQDGRVDTEKALALQTGLNLWVTSHHTMLGRMMTVAMRGIAVQQISFAMAQASADRDADALAALIQLARPIPLNKTSFAELFWMEREYAIGVWAKLKTEPEWQNADVETLLFDISNGVDPEVVRRFLIDPTSLQKADSDIIARHYLAEANKPWHRYWSEGIRKINENDFDVKFLSAVSSPYYPAYIATDRYSAFYYHVFAALADIYTGRASPGLPGRPAPTHWRWEWHTGPSPQVCLVSDTLHPSTKQAGADAQEQMCLEYFDEKAVEVLRP